MPASSRRDLRIATILAENYLPLARVLARSITEHHPEIGLDVFLVDRPLGGGAGPLDDFRQLTLGDLGIEATEYRKMASIYDVTELATAVKPWVLQALFEHSDVAVYLDPDIRLFSRLDELPALVREHGIVLTPHAPDGYPRDGLYPEEASILAAGVYNLGFIAVHQRSSDLLAWWQERLRRHCINDVTSMHFVDQRWIDFVPGMREHHILRHPGYNVAYWNLHGRTLERADSGWQVDGEPLRFFHFSGYSPEAPYLLSKHQSDKPRVLLSERPALQMLCDSYGDALVEAGWTAKPPPYGYASTAEGFPLDRLSRRLYRAALLASEAGESVEPPCPLDDADGGTAFVSWLCAEVHPLLDPVVSRYLHTLWKTNDSFREMAPVLVGDAARRFVVWMRAHSASHSSLPQQLVPDEPPPSWDHKSRRKGVLVVDASRGDGLDLLGPALGPVDPLETVVIGPSDDSDERRVNSLGSDVTVVLADAAVTFNLSLTAELDLLSERRLAAVWRWHTGLTSGACDAGARPVDEIWALSDHSAHVLSGLVPRTVRRLVVPVTPRDGAMALPLTEKARLSFCTVADPSLGVACGTGEVIAAYCAEFDENEGAQLLVSVGASATERESVEHLRYLARGRKDVVLLTDREVAPLDLAAAADCTVSLHKAIDFGMPLAVAMASGRIAIATAFSGNVDYMSEENSLLVSYLEAPGLGLPHTRWARPDVSSARRAMRRVFADGAMASAVGQAAAETMSGTHSAERAAASFLALTESLRSAPIRRDRGWFRALRDPLPRALPPR